MYYWNLKQLQCVTEDFDVMYIREILRFKP